MSTNPQQLMQALIAARGRLADSLSSERGAGLAEYALLLVLVTVAVAVTVGLLGDEIVTAVTEATTAIAD